MTIVYLSDADHPHIQAVTAYVRAECGAGVYVRRASAGTRTHVEGAADGAALLAGIRTVIGCARCGS